MSAVQNSSTDPFNPQNPVEQVIEGARKVGNEYCWPSTRAMAVAHALGELQQAVLGWELWELDATGSPRVIEWSSYEVKIGGPWQDVVASARRAAIQGLGERSMVGLWVNITWISERQASQDPAT